MKYLSRFTVTLVPLCLAAGCHREGPHYTVSTADGFAAQRPRVVVRRFYEKDTLLPGYHATGDVDCFAVPAVLVGTTLVPAGKAQPVLTDSFDLKVGVDQDDLRPTLRPISGTDSGWLRIQRAGRHLFGPPFTIEVSVVDARTGRTRDLASVADWIGSDTADGFAATRDGRQLLVIGDDKVTLTDTTSGRQADRPEWRVLCDVKNAQERAKHYPGFWFLTDDLRFIVNAPQIGSSGGRDGGISESTEPGPMLTAAGITFDAARDAVVFDTTTGKLSTTPVALYPTTDRWTFDRLTDAASVDGQLTLLYTPRRPGGGAGPIAVVTDAAGHVVASVPFRPADMWARVVGWDPARHLLAFDTDFVTGSGPPGPDAVDPHPVAATAAPPRTAVLLDYSADGSGAPSPPRSRNVSVDQAKFVSAVEKQ